MLHRRINHFPRDVPKNEIMKNTRNLWRYFRRYLLDFLTTFLHSSPPPPSFCYIFAHLICSVLQPSWLLMLIHGSILMWIQDSLSFLLYNLYNPVLDNFESSPGWLDSFINFLKKGSVFWIFCFRHLKMVVLLFFFLFHSVFHFVW